MDPLGLPTREDINVYDSLDEISACEHFLRKTLEQAKRLFRENAGYYDEDLWWMGPVAFRFYVPAFIHYLESKHSKRHASEVFGFAQLLEFWMEEPDEIAPIAGLLANACRYVLTYYRKFEVDPDIYGDLRPRFVSLESRLRQLDADAGDQRA